MLEIIRPIQPELWSLLMWQKFQCTGCKSCADQEACRGLMRNLENMKDGGRLNTPLKAEEWDVLLKWQRVCADLGNDCVECTLKEACCGKGSSLLNWVESLSRDFEVGIVNQAINSGDHNPCVTGCGLAEYKIRPLSVYHCVGFSALGTARHGKERK